MLPYELKHSNGDFIATDEQPANVTFSEREAAIETSKLSECTYFFSNINRSKKQILSEDVF